MAPSDVQVTHIYWILFSRLKIGLCSNSDNLTFILRVQLET